MKKKTIAITTVLIIIILSLIISLLNPLRKSNEKIQEDILELTPIGTSMDDVLKIIEENHWEIMWVNNEHKHEYTDLSGDFITGSKSVRASIGGYRNIFETDVQAYWGFDENSKLIEVGIRKDTNSL